MRRFFLPLSLAALLAACSPSPQPAAPQPAPTATPDAAASKPPAQAAQPAEVAKDIPVGRCGDQAAVAQGDRVFNTARWSTASEQDSFGFDVYRGDSEKGDFKKLTEQPILGAGTSDETHKYEYRDDSIDPCKEYWYYIEQTNTNGSHEKISPTFRAAAKRRDANAAPVPSNGTPANGAPAND